MADNRYLVEYAKTGKASCKNKTCDHDSKVIEKDEIRVSKVTLNPFDPDGGSNMNAWYHLSCIFEAMKRMKKGTKKIESEDDLDGSLARSSLRANS
jgi:hypothetical protein